MYLLFDIGGTNTRVGISQDGLKFTDNEIFPTSEDFQEGTSNILKFAEKTAGGKSFKAVAGGIAGPMDKEKTRIVNAPNLKGWNNQPLQELLEQRLNAPVYMENDTVMTGIGEAQAGAGKGHNIVAYITASTGIGGARIVGGVLDANNAGFEPGHQIVSDTDTVCTCGGKGHLEAFASGTALQKKCGQPADQIDNPVIWEETTRWLAKGLNNTMVYWSPDIIILGGSLMKRISIDKVRDHLLSMTGIFTTTFPLKPAELGDLGGLTGSLLYIRQKHP